MASEQQKAWLEEYLQCWNQTEAARRVGYKNAKVSGHNNKEKFADEIAERLQEKHMSADEVLMRLADQARNDLGPYINEFGTLDWQRLRQDGKTHLVKKYEVEQVHGGKLKVKIEGYDAQAALVHIGKVHGLFTDKLEHDVSDRMADNAAVLIAAMRKGASETSDEFGK